MHTVPGLLQDFLPPLLLSRVCLPLALPPDILRCVSQDATNPWYGASARVAIWRETIFFPALQLVNSWVDGGSPDRGPTSKLAHNDTRSPRIARK